MISVAARYAKAALILLSSAGAVGAAHAQAPAYPSIRGKRGQVLNYQFLIFQDLTPQR